LTTRQSKQETKRGKPGRGKKAAIFTTKKLNKKRNL